MHEFRTLIFRTYSQNPDGERLDQFDNLQRFRLHISSIFYCYNYYYGLITFSSFFSNSTDTAIKQFSFRERLSKENTIRNFTNN